MTTKTFSTSIHTPTVNDVLLGRGAGINGHPGNVHFRAVVKDHKHDYLATITNIQKYLIVMDILQVIRHLNPPGRFVTQDIGTGLWHDVGDEKARRKIGQALRENASSIRDTKKNDTNDKKNCRKSIIFTDYTKDRTYRDVRHAIEHEISKSDSLLRKQFCASYEHQQNPKADMVFSMEVSLPDVDKFLNEYNRSGKIKRQYQDSNNLSMIDLDSVGTFSIEGLSMNSNFEDDIGEKLDAMLVSFRVDHL